MKALVINCTLKLSPAPSNTEALADVVSAEMRRRGVEVETVRAVDLNLLPGVETDMGPGDDWPAVHDKLLNSEILIIVTPTSATPSPAGSPRRTTDGRAPGVSSRVRAGFAVGAPTGCDSSDRAAAGRDRISLPEGEGRRRGDRALVAHLAISAVDA
nr:NAD(P)H-dependent oxidoreductase [Herbidospora mongoliensis]